MCDEPSRSGAHQEIVAVISAKRLKELNLQPEEFQEIFGRFLVKTGAAAIASALRDDDTLEVDFDEQSLKRILPLLSEGVFCEIRDLNPDGSVKRYRRYTVPDLSAPDDAHLKGSQ